MSIAPLKRVSLTVAFAALALVSCSAVDETATYFSSVSEVNEQYVAAIASLDRVGADNSIAEIQTFFAGRMAALDTLLGGLVEAAPPSEVVDTHELFVAGVQEFADLSSAIADQVDDLDGASGIAALASHPVYGTANSNAVELRTVQACTDLQEFADGSDLAIDLACERLSDR